MWGLGQKFHKSNSLSPTAIRHLQDHFLNADTAGKVVGSVTGSWKNCVTGPRWELHPHRKA